MSWQYIWLMNASIGLEILLLLKLVYTGLAWRFRWFVAYLLFLVPRDIVTSRTPLNTRLYEQIWAWSGIMLLLLQTAAVSESYARIRAQIPDLGKWGRRFFAVICGIAAVVVFSTTWIDLRKPLTKSLTQAAYTISQRNLGLALAIVSILAIAIFFPFRVRLSRNSMVHGYIWTFYFAANAVLFGLMNLELVRRRSAGYGIMFTAIASYAAWALLLTRKGEELPPQQPPLSKQQMDSLAAREKELLDAERITRQLKPGPEAHRIREEHP